MRWPSAVVPKPRAADLCRTTKLQLYSTTRFLGMWLVDSILGITVARRKWDCWRWSGAVKDRACFSLYYACAMVNHHGVPPSCGKIVKRWPVRGYKKIGDHSPSASCIFSWDNQGILWNGRKNRYGIRNGWSMEWKIWCMEWNESSIFHTNSILAHFDMVLLKSGLSFSWTY